MTRKAHQEKPMIECPSCGHDEAFVQHRGGHRRDVRVYVDRGNVRAEKSIWKVVDGGDRDGFACSACGTQVRVPAKLIAAWRLEDEPVQLRAVLDLDEALASLRAVAGDATLAVHEEPLAAGTYGDFDQLGVSLPPELGTGVADRLGVPLNRLYLHQIEALRRIFAGENLVLQTPTASGKSLCYLLPVFRTLLANRDATALLVFPTKALAFDQRKKIAQISERFDERTLTADRFVWPLRFGAKTVWMGSYEAETKDHDQTEVKQKARLVVTNPDSLHVKILPHFSTRTGSWERFLRHLVFVVVDEIHVYRGLFGANVAYVLRRLRLLCDALGAKPQFFCSSATLPDPKGHAEQLVGLPFSAVTRSGSPRHRKAMLLWSPGAQQRPKKGEEVVQREPTTEAVDALSKVLLKPERPVQTITFVRALAGVERFNRTLINRLRGDRNANADRTRTYTSRARARERSEIAEGLLSGQVVHVTATNALELGIDIGDMNACLMIGYPGTVSSLWQQAGRVGRKGPAVVILFLRDDPLEQWFARNSKQFFDYIQRVEPLRLPIANPYVVAQHARCAAWELKPGLGKETLPGLTEELLARVFGAGAGEAIRKVFNREELLPPELRKGGRHYWLVKSTFPDVFHNIRVPISVGKFVVVDESGRDIGECDSLLVPRDLFPSAIWLNNGRYYRSKRILASQRTVVVESLDEGAVDYHTIAMPQTRLECMEKAGEARQTGGCVLGRGGVTVRREVRLYREVPLNPKSKKDEQVKATRTDPIEYDSTAFWLDLPESLLAGCGVDTEEAKAAIHAVEHALRSVFPFVADVDPADLGSSLDIGTARDGAFRCRLYLFDSFSGGTGLSDLAYERPGRLIEAAAELLASCGCRAGQGCPKCTILPWCESQNQDLSKPGARKLLGGLKAVTNLP